MKRLFTNFITVLILIPLVSCKNTEKRNISIDNKSYINNFELKMDNPKNNTLIEIKSPRAIIDLTSNDIQIFDSQIQVENKNGQYLKVESGNSTLNNTSKLIKVYDNVLINLIDEETSYINTKSFNWNLDTSNIVFNSPLEISFGNSKLFSSGGFYDINLTLLNIKENVLNRSIFNKDGIEQYRLRLESDNAKWLKDQKLIEFTSTNKQVETTLDFLLIK